MRVKGREKRWMGGKEEEGEWRKKKGHTQPHAQQSCPPYNPSVPRDFPHQAYSPPKRYIHPLHNPLGGIRPIWFKYIISAYLLPLSHSLLSLINCLTQLAHPPSRFADSLTRHCVGKKEANHKGRGLGG